MTKASLTFCAVAGGFALLMVGCASTNIAGLLMLKSGPNGDRVVTGNIKAVAQTTTTSLQSFGLKATATPNGDDIWISSQTRTGMKFTVVLSTDKSQPGVEKTHVSIRWDSQRDDHMHAQVLGSIEAVHKS